MGRGRRRRERSAARHRSVRLLLPLHSLLSSWLQLPAPGEDWSLWNFHTPSQSPLNSENSGSSPSSFAIHHTLLFLQQRWDSSREIIDGNYHQHQSKDFPFALAFYYLMTWEIRVKSVCAKEDQITLFSRQQRLLDDARTHMQRNCQLDVIGVDVLAANYLLSVIRKS